ncbi:MAG: phosphoenolpyruvate synthase [Caldilinea sp. CFX5]|nr:phosphoenolpyruvate synthase [Caldilinea sp. CFX5]
MTTQRAVGQMSSVIPLADGSVTLAMVGGKGANLAKLAHAGFPVPGGFLITTQAYQEFVQTNHLTETIRTGLQDAKLDDPATLETLSTEIRQRFRDGAMPVALADAIRAAYQQLGQPAVAVRSSATAEDLPEMSFAGQQDTYLNVLGEGALLQAVINCWGSLWTARAIGYRSRNGIPHDEVALSVVVQQMVQSEASGVLFTANPLTGNRNETVIDATLGLGEALVSGQVEPDHYIVETNSGRIVQKMLGAKALAIRGQAGGGTVTAHEDASRQQALPDPVIQAVTALGRQVAELYSAPQDIEWGWADGKLYLLQSRPITSLYPVPKVTFPEPLQAYFSFGAVQGVLDPMTPLGQDVIRMIFAGGARLFGLTYTLETQPLLVPAGERLWVRMTLVLRNRLGRQIIRKVLGVIEPSIGQIAEQLLTEPGLAATGWPQGTTLRRVGRFIRQLLPTLVRTVRSPDAERMAAQKLMASTVADFQVKLNATTTLAERVALLEQVAGSAFPFAVPNLIPRIAPGLLAMNRLIAWADATLPATNKGHRRALEIARGLPHNVTTEMDLMLWQTAQTIRGDQNALAFMQQQEAALLAEQYLAGNLPLVAQHAVHAFLAKYGMRGLAEIDFGRPRWRENPIQVMQILQSYLRIADPSQAPAAVFERGEAAAQRVIDDLAAAVRQQPNGAFKAKLVYALAKRMRAVAGLRESPKFFIINLFGIAREGLLQSGAELVAQGVLERPEDLMFLHVKELQALAAGYAINWQALVAERRALYEREKRRNQVPRVLLSDGRAFYEGMRDGKGDRDGVITGSPVSPGVVEGTVHVVFDPHDAQLAPGEILVCPGTDPAWTPLFLAAGGLVMEVGGLMTHGSVVAREYGIPAVVGVHEATSRLKTGQRIRVDGSSGEIVLVNGSGASDLA